MTLPEHNTQHAILVLDAMGVIYRVGDDVADLLVPFVREQGGVGDVEQVDAAYREASLGRIGAAEFWRRVGVSRDLESEYLRRHVLSDGLLDLVERARSRFGRVYCLSNDLSEWSLKLRRFFKLEPHFAGWYISGDLGLRKPDPQIYAHMLTDLAVDPAHVVYVDDRVKNLDPAADVGIHTVHYAVDGTQSGSRHRTIRRLAELLES